MTDEQMTQLKNSNFWWSSWLGVLLILALAGFISGQYDLTQQIKELKSGCTQVQKD